MVALLVSLVYRQIAGLSEAVRVLKEEGLLDIERKRLFIDKYGNLFP
jgi:hypothetical protein